MAEKHETKYADVFLSEYEQKVLAMFRLPDALRDYRLVSCLKSGERSVFVLCDEPGVRYILKMQPAGRSDDLKTEFVLLQSLMHPQLPKGICCFEEAGQEYLVREYIEGISLYELVMDQTLQSEGQCIDIALSLCEVLSTLHTQSPAIIHRDIKPQNVIIDRNGVCHLIDLGIARHYKEDETADTVFMGTRITAPPEQFGYHQTDARSDIYSMGMLMRFLVTGGYDALVKSSVSPGMDRLIARCTAFDPARRYQSISSLRRGLKLVQYRKFLRGGGIASAIVVCLLIVLLGLQPTASVAFSSPLLEQAVRQELKLSSREPIPSARLGEITELIVCGQEVMTKEVHEKVKWTRHDLYQTVVPRGDILDLHDLAKLTNLHTLVLDYQHIEDISPLADLPLEELSLTGNRIVDLSPLADSKTLTKLEVSQNPIADSTVFSKLPSLVNVSLNQTNITSLESFSGSYVENLNVWEAPITDYTPLTTCKNLHTLEINGLSDASLEMVLQLTSLRQLSLGTGGLVLDFQKFGLLKNLQQLDITGCKYRSLEGLEQLSDLNYLNLTETGTADVAYLKNLSALRNLELRKNSIADLTPLLNCPALNRVVFEENQRKQVEEQLTGASFELEIRPQ